MEALHCNQEWMNIGVNGCMLGGPKLDGDLRERRGDDVLLYCKLYVREGDLKTFHNNVVTDG